MKINVKAGLRAVFLMKRPIGSPVNPMEGKRVSKIDGTLVRQSLSTFTREPTVVYRHDVICLRLEIQCLGLKEGFTNDKIMIEKEEMIGSK